MKRNEFLQQVKQTKMRLKTDEQEMIKRRKMREEEKIRVIQEDNDRIDAIVKQRKIDSDKSEKYYDNIRAMMVKKRGEMAKKMLILRDKRRKKAEDLLNKRQEERERKIREYERMIEDEKKIHKLKN